MAYRFVEGRAYEAIPAYEGAKRRLVVCAGRTGQRVQLVWAEDLSIEDSRAYELDREIIQAERPDGLVYTISAAVPLDTSSAAVILDLVRNR